MSTDLNRVFSDVKENNVNSSIRRTLMGSSAMCNDGTLAKHLILELQHTKYR